KYLRFGIGARYHLPENRNRKAERAVAQTAQEFVGRQDFAARNSRHVGHEAFHLAHAARFQPVGELFFKMAIHGSALSRSAAPKAAKIARETSFSRQRHSGCHCRPSRKPFAPGIETASIVPSGTTASA